MANQKRLTDRGKMTLALERFAPLKVGQPPTPYSELGVKYNLSEKTIQTAIFDAFQRGLIVLREADIPPSYRELPHYEEQLRKKFPHLRMAIVIENTGENISNEAVNRALGHALACRIDRSASSFRSGDIIGVGTGSSVHYTVDMLSKFPALPVKDITIMSLTGTFFMLTNRTVDRRNTFENLVDADTNAAMLLKYFQGPVQVRPISFPIAHMPNTKHEVIRKTWLHGPEYQQYTPSHAIVGLGVFTEDNGLVQEVRRSGDAGVSPALGPIWPSLRNLVENIDMIKNVYWDYCPVGDICNYLFYIPPPKGYEIDTYLEQILASIQKNVSTINDMLLTAEPRHLRKIENVMLIAGTKGKSAGITYILNSDEINVHTICTDKVTAEYILMNVVNG